MKKNKQKKLKVVAAVLMSFSIIVPTIWSEKQVQAIDIVNDITVPQPIKVITANELSQIAGVFVTGSAVTGESLVSNIGYTVDSELVLENPFGSKELQKNMKEYEEWASSDEIKWKRYNWSGEKPVWEKGLTLSYWIKVPSGSDVGYHVSSALRWELMDENCYQVDDYAKYLTNLRYDKEIEGYSENYKEAAKREESKTVYGSNYFFKYLITDGVDEEGAPLPYLHRELNQLEGPVYDYRFLFGHYDDKIPAASFFEYNPRYQQGYTRASDGTYELLYEKGNYDSYNTLYMSEEDIRKTFKLQETDIITEGSVFIDKETTHRYSTSSIVRVANCYGEFQIDTDDSVLWVSDDKSGVQKNPNVSKTYGTVEWMQGGNRFYMNSWLESLIRNEQDHGTYESAVTKALSPITSIDASGEAVVYGNCDQWHQVTATLQNDWVEFYVDGVCVDVYNNYSTEGRYGINDGLQFKRLNKGMSLRYERNYPEYMRWNLHRGNFVARLFMDWLTDEDARLLKGENNPNQGITTPPGVSSESVSPDAVTTEAVYLGDVDGDDTVTLADATKILRFSLLLGEPGNEKQKFLADVDENGEVQLADATKALRMALLLDEWKELEYLAK